MITLASPRRSLEAAALPVLLAGSFMVVLDFFIVNVALPSIAAELGASSSQLEWVVSGYGLAFAALLISAGRLGDRVGRRRLYALGLGLFTAASAACAVAPTAELLVAARAAQGAAAAVLAPQVLAIIGVAYEREERTRALATYGITLGLAAIGGQVIGGVLLAVGDWRECFAINVPIGLTALALVRAVPESRAPRASRADVLGTLLLAGALVTVLLPLIDGRRLGWPTWTWAMLAAAPLLAGGFVTHQRALQRTGGSPLLDVAMLRARSFSAGLLTQLALAEVQAAFFVYLSIYLQQGRGLSPLAAGGVFTILAAAYVAVSGPATRWAERDGRGVVAAGGASLVAGLALLCVAVAADGSMLALVPGLLGAGVGIGCAFTPLTSVALRGVPVDSSGAGSAAMSTTQQVGYAAGVAITGLIFFGAGQDVTRAFELSLLQLTASSALVVLIARRLPAR